MKIFLKILNWLFWIPLTFVLILLPNCLGWTSEGIDNILWNAGYKFYFYSAFTVHILWGLFWFHVGTTVCINISKKIDKWGE